MVHFAGGEQLADAGKSHDIHGPHHVALVDGHGVGGLDTYVAGRVGTGKGRHLGTGNVITLAFTHADAHLAVGHAAEHFHASGDKLAFVAQDQVQVGSKRSRVKGGHEHIAGTDAWGGHHVIGALAHHDPQARLEQHLFGIAHDVVGDAIIAAVRSDDDGVDVATLTAAHFFDRAAHGGDNLDGLMILVMIEGFACGDMFTLFLFHAGNDPMEIVRNDSHALGAVASNNGIVADGAQQMDVKPFLEFYSCHELQIYNDFIILLIM